MPAITGYILLLFPADTDGTWCDIHCLNPAYTISTLGVVPAAPSDTCLFMVLPTAAGTFFTFWSLPAVIRCTWSNFMALYLAGTMCALCLVPAAPLDTSLPILLPRAAVAVSTFLTLPAATSCAWSDVIWFHPARTMCALSLVPAAPVNTCLPILLPRAAVTVFTFFSFPAVTCCAWSDVIWFYPAGTMCALSLVPAALVSTCFPILLPRAAVTVFTFSSFPAATCCAWSDVIWFHPAGTMCALSLVLVAPSYTCLFMVLLQRLVQSLRFCLSQPLPLVHDQIFLASPRPIPCMHYALSQPPL